MHPQIGDIAVYYDAVEEWIHSAVVTGVNANDPNNPICRSKWGANGLFEHYLTSVPDAYHFIPGSNIIACKFFSYSYAHTWLVSGYTSSGHTRECTICDKVVTEAHVMNPRTEKCITCGYQGGVTVPITSIEHLCDGTCSHESEK